MNVWSSSPKAWYKLHLKLIFKHKKMDNNMETFLMEFQLCGFFRLPRDRWLRVVKEEKKKLWNEKCPISQCKNQIYSPNKHSQKFWILWLKADSRTFGNLIASSYSYALSRYYINDCLLYTSTVKYIDKEAVMYFEK